MLSAINKELSPRSLFRTFPKTIRKPSPSDPAATLRSIVLFAGFTIKKSRGNIGILTLMGLGAQISSQNNTIFHSRFQNETMACGSKGNILLYLDIVRV
mmetsp:Transcript_25692/g.42144  ORF Transcript_25692/g.42144 Transcript_25692/m.42144 type:complete len:99 (+) Transcript_25692:410-706(+)